MFCSVLGLIIYMRKIFVLGINVEVEFSQNLAA